ncbi:MAG: RidA family protein [Deltaproteobacteria bacterium]|nr:RidA family protein [Deltaproteobacteria bacterium]MBW2362746.1 RidA family protein [Deltaproteobacteria bacterium]
MKIEHINPSGLAEPTGYSHVVATSGGRTLYLAGQGAYDANGKLVGAGDYEAQTRQAFRNLVTALEGAGGGPENIVFCTIYVVRLDDAALGAFIRGMNDALDGRPMPPSASTMVGIERLAYEEMLVEINAVAVV